jgi:hypothetical protein
METRSGEMNSLQIARMGIIENLLNADFSLTDGNSFLIKNDGDDPVELEVQLAAMGDEFISTIFDTGWNPEIVRKIKQTSDEVNLKWGY